MAMVCIVVVFFTVAVHFLGRAVAEAVRRKGKLFLFVVGVVLMGIVIAVAVRISAMAVCLVAVAVFAISVVM